jgi:imidazolonepropionase-like amidohydrolase
MRLCFAIVLLASSTAVAAQEVRRHAVIFQGRVGGLQTTTIEEEEEGPLVVDFSYRNNGRGPDLREEIRLAPDGTMVAYRAAGKSTFGAAIEDSYVRDGLRSSWKSMADSGNLRHDLPAIYVPAVVVTEGSPETLAIITRAVLRGGDEMFAALPAGALRVEKLTETTLTAEGDDDEPFGVALYALHGLTIRPVFLWLAEDDSKGLAAMIDPGRRQVILEGRESHADALEKLQLDAERRLLATIAKRLTHRLAEPIVLRDVRVFDSSAGALSDLSDVYVADGRIAAIYPAGSTARGARTIVEGGGRTLLPGLYDMHDHEGPWRALLQIASGVTTGRDLANDNERLAELIMRIEAGEFVGPRIVRAGFIEGESPHSARSGIVVGDLQAAKDAVDWYAQRGFRQIKIYNSFRPDWVAGVAAHAHALGMRVSGHIPAFMKAEEAVRAGYDEIQHINQAMLNFIVKPEDDTRTLARFTLIADNAHRLDLDSAEVQGFIALMKERGTTLDATVAIFESMFTQMHGEPNPTYRMVESHVPIALRQQWRTAAMDVNPGNIDAWRASYDKCLQFIGRLHQAGVPIVAGTDDIAGFTLYRELELYVKPGIPAADVLQIATRNAAEATGTLDSRGTIEPGKLADLILVDGDPIANISDIRRVSFVMKGGVAFYPAEVYESVGVTRFLDPPQVTAVESNGAAPAAKH